MSTPSLAGRTIRATGFHAPAPDRIEAFENILICVDAGGDIASVTLPADPDGRVRLIRVLATVNFHVAVGNTATVDDMPVSAGFPGVIIHLEAGAELSAVKAAGAADGDVWFTEVRRF